MILAQDPVLSSDIIDQFLRLISSTPLYELQQDKLKIAVLLPLAVGINFISINKKKNLNIH